MHKDNKKCNAFLHRFGQLMWIFAKLFNYIEKKAFSIILKNLTSLSKTALRMQGQLLTKVFYNIKSKNLHPINEWILRQVFKMQ